MRLLLLLILFFIVVVGVGFFPTAVFALVPLEWHETSYMLVPGYRYSVSLHMEVARYPTCSGCYARAGFEAGPFRVILDVGGNMLRHYAALRIYVANEMVAEYDLGTVPCTCTAYDARLTIDCDHAGNCVVYYGGQRAAQFSIDGPTPIAVLEEECSMPLLPTARSSVDVRTIGPIGPAEDAEEEGSTDTTTVTTTTVVLPPPPTRDTTQGVANAIGGAVAAGLPCYFLLNYARATWAGLEVERSNSGLTCYFLLNYADEMRVLARALRILCGLAIFF